MMQQQQKPFLPSFLSSLALLPPKKKSSRKDKKE
jgi:hypothetical protein